MPIYLSCTELCGCSDGCQNAGGSINTSDLCGLDSDDDNDDDDDDDDDNCFCCAMYLSTFEWGKIHMKTILKAMQIIIIVFNYSLLEHICDIEICHHYHYKYS